MNTDISAAKDNGEAVALMEPLLIPEGSRHREMLIDLAVELAARSAGFRRSLPEGVLTALADLVRAAHCLPRQAAFLKPSCTGASCHAEKFPVLSAQASALYGIFTCTMPPIVDD